MGMAKMVLIAALLVMAAVVIVLGVGIGNFGKGGREGGRFSNKMMQWRIGLQFLAVILILVFVVLTQGG